MISSAPRFVLRLSKDERRAFQHNLVITLVVAPNIDLLHFYELYYLRYHYGFEISELRKTRFKFAARFFTFCFWPFMWRCSLIAVIGAEKDPVQRRLNWRILSYLFHPALWVSDNIVVKAKKQSFS
jgi:hypothetical protein